jgi:hypothetical protein
MILLFFFNKAQRNFDFNKVQTFWIVVDDAVMGGESSSTFKLNDDGFGVFSKAVYTVDNNGRILLFCALSIQKNNDRNTLHCH